MATDAQLRLLRAVAERLGAESVVEVHLFAPIRQGGVESGVAVVAADERVAAVEGVAGDEPGAAATVAALGGPPPEIQDGAEPSAERTHSIAERTETFPAAPPPDEPAPDVPSAACDPTDAAAGPPPARRSDAAAYRPARFAVHTARYRLTLKGPDRGKWEVDVRAEADAPLLTVDAVVRGVQRRAGEAADSERLDGEQFRALLPPEPEWSGATSSRRPR